VETQNHNRLARGQTLGWIAVEWAPKTAPKVVLFRHLSAGSSIHVGKAVVWRARRGLNGAENERQAAASRRRSGQHPLGQTQVGGSP
jgi:hypothetical protein